MLESIAAESPKFTAPLLLIHGLWCTARVWRSFMGYLAHRGWGCQALNLRPHNDASFRNPIREVRFADYLGAVRQVIAACDAPPIVVGHDLGGLLALCCRAHTRATVALAPLVPRSIAPTSIRALFGLRSRVAVLRSRPLPAPRGKLGVAYFGSGVPGGTAPDSGWVVRELAREDLRVPHDVGAPALVLAGGRDPFCPPNALARLADYFGATLRQVDGAGHAMPWEPGWEQRVSEIHRWLIQTLGDALLANREDEEE